MRKLKIKEIKRGHKIRHKRYKLTGKKENQIFFICQEIQTGAVAKSYMTNGLLIYC
jgi:hypothetical protein